MTSAPPDPRRWLPAGPDPAAAVRPLEVFGLPFEARYVPGRDRRPGVAGGPRPPFDEGRGPRIREGEALWRGAHCVLTPNRHPFAAPHGLLWAARGEPREWPEPFLAEVFGLLEHWGGLLLGNTIGAAATVPLAHLHWLDRPAQAPAALLAERARLPFAVAAVSEASPARRAAAVRRLLDRRTTAPANLVAFGPHALVFPRRREIPAPHFPHALGAMELAGAFVYPDEAGFHRAEARDLERALEEALVPA